jgi:predicted MPP superfamily phosphohydrolase
VRIARILGTGAATLIAGGLGFVAWAAAIERRRFTLRRYELPVLPAGAAPVKVLHLADFHYAPGQRKKQRFVRSLAKHEPDLIIATGDNYGHRDGLAGIAEMLEPFRGVPGLSVFGSNDYYGPIFKNPFTYFTGKKIKVERQPDLDEAGLRELLFDDLGWVDLTNSAAIVRAGGLRIRAVGVDDPHIHLDKPDAALADLERLARRGGEWDVTLGLVHAPYQRILNRYIEDTDVAAIFAGHTHGGQVCLPGGRAIIANCDLPKDQAGGVSEWSSGGRSVPLHVSRGLGTSIYAPYRTFCPPEASLIMLTARA